MRAKDLDARCRACYVSLARETRRRGLDAQAARESAAALSRRIDGTWYLRERAFKPTGIALGCPLPAGTVADRLWRIVNVAARRIALLDPERRPAFSFVPREWYHTTIVNRSHYTIDSSMAEGGSMVRMFDEERRQVREIVAECGLREIVVHLNGMLLTRGGRLIVPGFPADDRLYDLRRKLVRELPQLGVNTPVTCHVKVGHLIAPFGPSESEAVLRIIAHCGDHVSARLAFHDVFTPAGRVAFSGGADA